MPLQTFRHYTICQDHQGTTVEVWRSNDEVACLAFDNKLRHFVELHVAIGPAERQRDTASFQNLVQLAAPLRHPHLLGVIEGGEDEGANYHVSEYLDGERLDTWLARCHPLPPWLALLVICQVVEGLATLASHPRLLAGVEVFHAGLTMAGPQPEDLIVKVCDLGLSGTLPASTEPRFVEARAIHETGRLLLYMLTGSLTAGPVTATDLAGRQMPPELSFLLNTLFNASQPHHPRTLEQLRTLTERCLHDLSPEVLTRPELLPAAYRPRLPLALHMPDPAGFADLISNDYTLDPRPFDAADPYRHRGTERATRRAVNVQLLPPANLLPAEFCQPLIDKAWTALTAKGPSASETDVMGPHPHLLAPLAWHPELPAPLVVEELPGKFNLGTLRRLRHPMEPVEVLLILDQLKEAASAAEARGLTLHWRDPRLIPLQFVARGGESSLPPPAQLARQPLTAWPPFLLKVRTWPTTLDFSQPDRFFLERLLPRDPALSGDPPVLRPGACPTPGVRDFALLATWLLGGTPRVPDLFKPLLFAAISARGPGPGSLTDFLDRLHQRLGSPPSTSTGPLPMTGSDQPAIPVLTLGKSKAKSRLKTSPVPVPSAPSARHSSLTGPESEQFGPLTVAPLYPRAADNSKAPHARSLTETPDAFPLGRDAPPNEDELPVLGFAEALFGGSTESTQEPSRPDWPDSREVLPVWPAFAGDDPSHDPYAPYSEGNIAQAPLGFMEAAGQATPWDPDQEPAHHPVSRGKLVLLVVVIAAVIAALMAHFSGQAIWLQ